MDINELSKNLALVKQYCNIYFDDDDALIENIIMPSALGYIQSFTKRTIEELSGHPEIANAFLAICLHMYDNRGVATDTQHINYILQQTLGMHSFYIGYWGDLNATIN